MSLAEDLRGVVMPRPDLPGARRTHRIGKPEELEEEKSMPRKPRDAGAAPTIEEAAERAAARHPRKKKRRYTNRAKAAADPLRKKGDAGVDATFVIDDVGRIAIVAADDLRIELTQAATRRLALFIDRTKAMRT